MPMPSFTKEELIKRIERLCSEARRHTGGSLRLDAYGMSDYAMELVHKVDSGEIE